MDNEVNTSKEVEIILSDKRFEMGRVEVQRKLSQFKNDGLIDDWQYDQILESDLDLEIKYRTFKKCINRVFAGLILISLGLILGTFFPLIYLFMIIGVIVTISAFFGLRPNKLSKAQIKYLNR